MAGRSAASSTGGGTAGGRSRVNRRTVNVSYAPSMVSPRSAARRNRSTSRVRLTGSSNATAFQSRTSTGEDAPTPSAKRPGAASASAAALIASNAGPRVKTGVIAVPRRSRGAQAAASASGVNASVPATSDDQTSVKPARSRVS